MNTLAEFQGETSATVDKYWIELALTRNIPQASDTWYKGRAGFFASLKPMSCCKTRTSYPALYAG